MQRRDFLQVSGEYSRIEAHPGFGESAQDSRPGAPDGFNRYTKDYAQFCALPPEKRVFYRLSGDRIVEAKPDDAAGKPSAWGEPSALPIPGGSWDGVPMESPIPNLAGEGPYKPTWDSLLEYDAPEWYPSTRSSVSGPTGARSACPKPAIGTPQHVRRGPAAIQVSPRTLRAALALRLQGPLRAVDAAELGTRRTHRALQEGRREVFQLRSPIITTGFDAWASRHQPWNAAAIGPHRDVVGTWAAAARKQGLRLGVTVHQATQTGGGSSRRTARTNPVRWPAFLTTANSQPPGAETSGGWGSTRSTSTA